MGYDITYMPNDRKHSGISGIPTQLMVVHSGECPLRGGYAQSLTNWANTTAVEASWHWFADPIAIVSMVDPMKAAWHASEANPMSEGFEQAGYARFSRAEWLTPEGRESIDNLAWILVQRMKANDIPHRWLTTAEVEAVTKWGNRSIKGLCLHRQIDPETRTDPGDNYPFDVLDERIRVHLGQAPAPAPTPTEEEDDEMFVIASDSAVGDGKIWIGNGSVRTHIPDPPTLKAMQDMASWGILKIYKNGEVQNLPQNALGVDLVEKVTARVLDTEIPRGGRGLELGPTSTLGSVVSWFDNAVIGLADTIQASANQDGATAEELVAGLKQALAEGIQVDVTATATVKE